MNIKERMYKVFNETIEYYDSSEKFGYDYENDKCSYITDDGKMCAVGRCITEDARTEWENRDFGSISGVRHELGDVQHCFKDEYRGLPFPFWEKLQYAHDRSALDKHERISERLIEKVKEFIDNYAETGE